MERNEFIKKIGLSSQALLGFYCFGASGCSNSPLTDTEGLTGNAETANGKIDFSLDLLRGAARTRRFCPCR